MKFSRYLQEIPQTDDEKVEMYKKCSIEELAKMHVERERQFDIVYKNWLSCSNRYMDNEKFLIKYLNLGFLKRMINGKKLIKEYIDEILEKYNF